MSEIQNQSAALMPYGQNIQAYGGVTVFETSDGGVGLAANLDPGDVKKAQRARIGESDEKFFDRALAAASIANIGLGAYEATSKLVLMAPNVTLGVLGLTASYLVFPRIRKRNRRAAEIVAERATYIPSKDIRVDLEDLPQTLPLSTGSAETCEAVRVLQALQTSHLDSESRSKYDAQRPNHINPAMVARAALIGVDEQSRPKMIEPLFDNVTELGSLTQSLDRYAGLSATKAGREGLQQQTTALLGVLGEVATTFIDLKANQAVPQVEGLIDIADDELIREGLVEVKATLSSPQLTYNRYDLAVRNWSTE